MKIAFFGTGNFSKNILNDILDFKNIDICLTVSQPDKLVGRKKILEKTFVKKFSEYKNIKCLQPKKLKNNSDFFKELKSLNLDFIIVVAYGKIIPKEILEIPKYGCINIHGSILPNYRGASPIQESLKNGDRKTGLTIMYMSEGMDEGDVLKIQEISVDNMDKTPDIFKKFEKIGPKLLIDTLNLIVNGKIKGQAQNHRLATYCSKISKNDGKINFCIDGAKQIYNKFRAYFPWPGIYAFYKDKKIIIEDCEIYTPSINSFLKKYENDKKSFFYNGEDLDVGRVVKIDKKNIGIVCKDKKILILKQVKLEGKKSMDIFSFVNGNKEFLNYKF